MREAQGSFSSPGGRRLPLAALGLLLAVLVLAQCGRAQAPAQPPRTVAMSTVRPSSTPWATPTPGTPFVWRAGPVVSVTVTLRAMVLPQGPWVERPLPDVRPGPTPTDTCGHIQGCYSQTFVSPDGRLRLPALCDVISSHGPDCQWLVIGGYMLRGRVSSWSPDQRFALTCDQSYSGGCYHYWVWDMDAEQPVLYVPALYHQALWDPSQPHLLLYLGGDIATNPPRRILAGVDLGTRQAWAYSRCPDALPGGVNLPCASVVLPSDNVEACCLAAWVQQEPVPAPPITSRYDTVLADSSGEVRLAAQCHVHAQLPDPHCIVTFPNGRKMNYAGTPRWSADGPYLLTCGVLYHYGYCDYYQVWDVVAGAPLEVDLPRTVDRLHTPWFAWSPEGHMLAFVPLDQYQPAGVRLLDAATGSIGDTRYCPDWVLAPAHVTENADLATICR